jgi:hypothetical protein
LGREKVRRREVWKYGSRKFGSMEVGSLEVRSTIKKKGFE